MERDSLEWGGVGGRSGGWGGWSSMEIFQQVDTQLCFSEISFTAVFMAHEMVERKPRDGGPLVKKLLQAQGDKTWNTAVGALQRDRCGRPSKKEAIKTERLFEQTRGEESEICDFF